MATSIPSIDLQKKFLTILFKGELGNAYFCAKSKDEYFLFKRSTENGLKARPANDSITGWRINDDLTWNKENNFFEKGHFFELRLGLFPASITFEAGTKVLALKPTSNDMFSVKFYPATIVSGAKTCERKIKHTFPDRERHEYEVVFDDEKEKTYNVYEEFIAPLEKHWGNIKDKYSAEDNGEEENQKSEEKKDKSTEEKEGRDSSTSEDEEEKKKKHHHKHHKHHSHSKKERKHKNSSQSSIIIVPIVVPYGNFTQQIPYFYH